MFVALKSITGNIHIDMLYLHGRGTYHHLMESGLGNGPIQFVVDHEISEIFWSDASVKRIMFTNFEGTL